MRLVWVLSVVVLAGWPAGAGEVEFRFKSSFDGKEQLAVAYVPAGREKTPSPLLVEAHFYGGDRFTAKGLGFYPQCDQRGWLLVCPELHGQRVEGKFSLGAPEAQHDVLDAIAWMQANYAVDASRIYLDGRSMGGMLAALVAAKWPEVFAAAVAGQPVTDVEAWLHENPGFGDSFEKELGKLTPETGFAYGRRSALRYAVNLQYVPFILWHGTLDEIVPSSHSARLDEAIRAHHPYQPPVNWLVGATHNPMNYDARWICDRLEYYRNLPAADSGLTTRSYPRLELVTDESKAFFWLTIAMREPGGLAHVVAEFREGTLSIVAENAAELVVDRAKVNRRIECRRWEAKADGPLRLRMVNGARELAAATITGAGQGEVAATP